MEYVTAVPHPRSEASGPARSGRRSLALALLFGALGAVVALLASRQGWSEGTATVAGGDFPLSAKGGDVTGVPASLAIVGLAALVAVFAVRRAGRFLVAGLLALSGAGTVVSALLGASDTSALDEKAAQASGDSGATVDAMTHTAWPYVAAAGACCCSSPGSSRCGTGGSGRPCPGATSATARPALARPGPRPTPSGPRRSGRRWTGVRTPRGRERFAGFR